MAFAFSIWRLSVWRGQPANGLPSGSMTSQTRRATFPFGCDHGKMRNVSRSGTSPMSDSSMRVKPSIEDPSNWISPSSAFSNCERGTSTFLMIPRMSVNCRRRKRTPSLSQVFRISTALIPAILVPPCFSDFGSRRAENPFRALQSQPKTGICTPNCARNTCPDQSVLFYGRSLGRTVCAASGRPPEKLGPCRRSCHSVQRTARTAAARRRRATAPRRTRREAAFQAGSGDSSDGSRMRASSGKSNRPMPGRGTFPGPDPAVLRKLRA